jgi:hypothetical protein
LAHRPAPGNRDAITDNHGARIIDLEALAAVQLDREDAIRV